MFEVILTCRPDLREVAFVRCLSMEEACMTAWEMVELNRKELVRAWVRIVREAPVPHEDWE